MAAAVGGGERGAGGAGAPQERRGGERGRAGELRSEAGTARRSARASSRAAGAGAGAGPGRFVYVSAGQRVGRELGAARALAWRRAVVRRSPVR